MEIFNALNRLKTKLIHLNLFKRYTGDPEITRREILSTRVFILFFLIALLIIVLFTSISLQINTVLIREPDLETYYHLYQSYWQALECPCSDISISYKKFVQINISFHQICSSIFTSQGWLNLTYKRDLNRYWRMDIRYSLNSMWQLISSFCRAAQKEAHNFLLNFGDDSILTPAVVNENYLKTQVEAALNDMLDSLVTTFTTDLNIISTTTYINGFMTALSTNFILLFGFVGGGKPTVFFKEMHYLMPSTGKICYNHRDGSCEIPAGVYFSDIFDTVAILNLNTTRPAYTFPGLVFDTLPFNIVLQSSLECFYDSRCMELLLSLYPTSIDVSILNAFKPSRFQSNTTLQTIIHELFIENITSNILFQSYFQACKVVYCQYSYSRRFDWIYVLTTIMSLIGGLNTVLRITSPLVVRIGMLIKRKINCHRRFVPTDQRNFN